MGGAVFPPCYLTWGQTMVEVMKIMATSFKRSHAHTATLSAPNPAAGHHWPTPPLETPGHSWASQGQSLVESLLLSPGCWCTQGPVSALQSQFPQSCVSSGSSVVGLMATSSKRAYAIPRSTAPRAPDPVAVHCWPIPLQETLKHSCLSLCWVSGPWFHPSHHLAGASLPLDVGYLLTAPPAPRSHRSSATELQHHSLNQDKLEVIKREVARVNTDVLGISKLKWTGMGGFNSDDHYIYDCGQESLRRKEVAIIINKRVWNAVLGCNLKNDKMISAHFQGKPFNITVIQVYSLTSNAEEAEVEQFYKDL